VIGSRIFDALEQGLARAAPRQALSAAGLLGQVRNRLSRRWPSPEQVRSLFPHLDRSAAARLAWRIGGLEARNRVLVAGLRRTGLEPARSLVRCPEAFAALRPPLLLGTFHVGAVHALGLALDRLSGPVLALRQGGPLADPRPPVEVVATEGEAQGRAAVFHRALLHLERGGFVILALDAASDPALRVPCLGRTLPLARGAFALARLTGAPLVPLAARWRGGRIEIVLGEALAPAVPAGSAPETWESALAAAAAGWLERYLLQEPAETGLGLLRVLLGLDLNGS
jgi:hypothetical protein